MINRRHISLIFLITVCFIFFQDIAFIIGKQAFYIAPLLIIFILSCFFIANPKSYLLKIKSLFEKTPFNYLIYYVFWVIISAFLCGSFSVSLKCILRIILIYGLTIIPAVLFPVFVLPKYISAKKILKIFTCIYIFIMLYGIFHYIVSLLNINFLSDIHKLFCTKQLAISNTDYGELILMAKRKTVRAMSVFFEASFFGTFIFVFLPFTYKITLSSYKILKNSILNKILKISIIFLTWINLFLTQSPIYILVSGLYSLIFFRKILIKLIIKNFPIFILASIIIPTTFLLNISHRSFIESENRIIKRVTETVNSIGSMDRLVINEPSLATRIISNYNGLMVGLKYHPIKGTGYGNAKDSIVLSMKNLNIPLTDEVILITFTLDIANAPPSIFFAVICQTGIIGVILLYLFFINTILEAKKIKKCYVGNSYFLLDICYLISINFLVISFYWSIESYPMMWFILGILHSYILIYNKTLIKTRRLLLEQHREDS